MDTRLALSDICRKLSCDTIHTGEKDYVKGIVASGLMSDVLTIDTEEVLLVSNLTTSQVVRTADMVSANAILITNGKPIMNDTVSLAKELNITLMTTELPLFDACYLLGKLTRGE